MTKAHSDQFEMRRLESLSNTIFGVAMTLLAYGLPQAAQFDHAPNWADLYHAFGGRLVGLVMSFVVAGVFWFSHNRRLARQPWGGRWVVMLNLLFLLSIVLLPVTNGLYGNYGMSSTIAMLYGLHLTAIGGLNALLWRLAAGPGFQSRTRRLRVSAPDVHPRHGGRGDLAEIRDLLLAARLRRAVCEPAAQPASRRGLGRHHGREAPGR